MLSAADTTNDFDTHGHPTGWRRYLYSTNHKDIGTMYFVFAMCAGLIGGILSVVIRMELQQPGLQIFTNTHTYNVFVTRAYPAGLESGDSQRSADERVWRP